MHLLLFLFLCIVKIFVVDLVAIIKALGYVLSQTNEPLGRHCRVRRVFIKGANLMLDSWRWAFPIKLHWIASLLLIWRVSQLMWYQCLNALMLVSFLHNKATSCIISLAIALLIELTKWGAVWVVAYEWLDNSTLILWAVDLGGLNLTHVLLLLLLLTYDDWLGFWVTSEVATRHILTGLAALVWVNSLLSIVIVLLHYDRLELQVFILTFKC